MKSSRVTTAVKAIMEVLSYTLTTGKEGETDEHGCQPQNEQGRQPDGEILRLHRRFSLSLPGRPFSRPLVPETIRDRVAGGGFLACAVRSCSERLLCWE
jgi:hypothetical protein